MGAEGTKHTRFSHAAFRHALGSFLDNFMIGLSNTLQRNYLVDGCEVQFGDRKSVEAVYRSKLRNGL
jgi:hypothetical protein